MMPDLRPPRASPRPQGSLLLGVGARRWLLTPQLCRGCEAKASGGSASPVLGVEHEPCAEDVRPRLAGGARALCCGGSASPVLGRGARALCWGGPGPPVLPVLLLLQGLEFVQETLACLRVWPGGGGLWALAPGAHL